MPPGARMRSSSRTNAKVSYTCSRVSSEMMVPASPSAKVVGPSKFSTRSTPGPGRMSVPM